MGCGRPRIADEQQTDTPLSFCGLSKLLQQKSDSWVFGGRKYWFAIMRYENYDLDGETIRIPIAESYKDCIALIKSDRFRLSGRMESFIMIALKCFIPFSWTLLFWLRLSQYKGILYPFCRFMYERVSRKAQVQISPTTKIGYGFYIGHNICMVVNGGTIIGNNVNISQFLNIGTNNRTPAIIGDNVYIGPQVSIVENVKIGSNSSIGAGAVVVKDVPQNATVAGVPAKILNYNNPGRYVNKRYTIK